MFSRSGLLDGYYSGNHYNMFGIRQKDDVVSALMFFLIKTYEGA